MSGVDQMSGPEKTAGSVGEADTRIPVVNIVGTTRSGSTLVELLLGQLHGFVDVGELRYLWFRRLVKGGNMLCGCGTLLRECPFWEGVGMEAFGGWDQLARTDVLNLARAVERERYVPLLFQPRAWPAYERKVRTYAALLERLFRAIQVVSGARVVVDASKLLSHAFVLRHVEGLDVRSLHIVRDCRGVAFSWRKHVARPETVGGVSYMPQFRPSAIAARWLYDNAGAHLLTALGGQRAFMRYEMFARAPREELGRVLTSLGEASASKELGRFVEDAVALEPTHSVSGNPMRFRTGEVRIQLDEQWRRDMPNHDRRIVTVLAWPLLRAYGYTGESGQGPGHSAPTMEN
jgi:Sulfotransferase family